jgi:hypothetical protein
MNLLKAIFALSVCSFLMLAVCTDVIAQRKKKPTSRTSTVKKAAPVQEQIEAQTQPSPQNSASIKEEQSSASLEETMNWLGGKLTDHNFIQKITSDNNESYFDSPYSNAKEFETNFSVDNCNLTILSALIVVSPESTINDTVKFSFSDIDPLSIKDNGGISLETTGSRKNINLKKEWLGKWAGEARPKNYQASVITFHLNKDHDRFKRAFQHAVKLCDGKVDPF